jgi:hypothetical protein
MEKMSKIKQTLVIIGDSWGVPNYAPINYINNTIEKIKTLYSDDVEINVTHLGDPSDTHLELLLENEGYNVINFAKNGGTNLETIREAKQYFLVNLTEVDWLIWFHTESLRDRNEILTSPQIKFSIPKLTKDLAILAYQEFTDLISTLKCKTIVIGGQAPIDVDDFDNIVGQIELLIEDWHSEILGIKLPFSHGVCNLDLFDSANCTDSIEEKSKMLDNIDTILKLDCASSEFPDNAHPGKHAHKKLFDKLNYLLTRNNKDA